MDLPTDTNLIMHHALIILQRFEALLKYNPINNTMRTISCNDYWSLLLGEDATYFMWNLIHLRKTRRVYDMIGQFTIGTRSKAYYAMICFIDHGLLRTVQYNKKLSQLLHSSLSFH